MVADLFRERFPLQCVALLFSLFFFSFYYNFFLLINCLIQNGVITGWTSNCVITKQVMLCNLHGFSNSSRSSTLRMSFVPYRFEILLFSPFKFEEERLSKILIYWSVRFPVKFDEAGNALKFTSSRSPPPPLLFPFFSLPSSSIASPLADSPLSSVQAGQ